MYDSCNLKMSDYMKNVIDYNRLRLPHVWVIEEDYTNRKMVAVSLRLLFIILTYFVLTETYISLDI
jgi:hypothetical protein